MLSYQHSYHAGCFADVMKHAILTRIVNYLTQKDNPLLYLDTHAGRGEYDLQHEHSLKTNEAQWGIQPLWEKRMELSSLFLPYMKIIECLNTSDTLRHYPGSPEIAIQLLRQHDRLVFCELHPAEFDFLDQLPHQGRRVYCKKEDGLKNIKALLPPMERRGLVFTDPSYEKKNEYQEVVQSFKAAYKRFPTGTYCLWYPYINNAVPDRFLNDLEDINNQDTKKYLRLEFHLNQKSGGGMTGSGLWVINPPYLLAEEGKRMLEELTQIIQPDSASCLVEG